MRLNSSCRVVDRKVSWPYRVTPEDESPDAPAKPERSRRFAVGFRHRAGFLTPLKNQQLAGRFRDKNKRLLHDSRLFPRCRSLMSHGAGGASRARGGFKTRMSGRAENSRQHLAWRKNTNPAALLRRCSERVHLAVKVGGRGR